MLSSLADVCRICTETWRLRFPGLKITFSEILGTSSNKVQPATSHKTIILIHAFVTTSNLSKSLV